MELIALSENSVLILFEQQISQTVFHQVTQCAAIIDSELSHYLVDMVPAYASIHMVFNTTRISHSDFQNKLKKIVQQAELQQVTSKEQTVIEMPVYYGEEVALDIQLIADNAKLTVDDVIRIHSQTAYDIYAIGFSPGFAYMGNVDQRIAMARKQTPRKKIAAGSVGIADQQTAIYPAELPGGWQILGRTPLSVIDYSSSRLTRLEVGNKVRFIPINREDFMAMGGQLPETSVCL